MPAVQQGHLCLGWPCFHRSIRRLWQFQLKISLCVVHVSLLILRVDISDGISATSLHRNNRSLCFSLRFLGNDLARRSKWGQVLQNYEFPAFGGPVFAATDRLENR